MKGGDADARPNRRRLTEADYLHARLPEFESRVARSLEWIDHCVRRRRAIMVSFSGGKDSTVTLDLVRRIQPHAPAVWFDSGAELDTTRALCARAGAERIEPEITVIELWKQRGYGGHPATNPEAAKLNLQRILIDDPSERAMRKLGCDAVAIGLRADESAARRKSAKYHGAMYRTVMGWVRLCPILDWSYRDVWAYIASRSLDYNEAYDRMAEMGIPAEMQRVSTLLDGNAIPVGRYVYLKRCEPALFNRLAAEFPKLRAYA